MKLFSVLSMPESGTFNIETPENATRPNPDPDISESINCSSKVFIPVTVIFVPFSTKKVLSSDLAKPPSIPVTTPMG